MCVLLILISRRAMRKRRKRTQQSIVQFIGTVTAEVTCYDDCFEDHSVKYINWNELIRVTVYTTDVL